MEKDYKEIYEKINKAISETSKTLSDTCRYVVFTLLAFVWAMLMKEETLIVINNIFVLSFFILMVTYFLVDIAQYLITLIQYRKHANVLYKIIEIIKNEDKYTKKEKEMFIKNSEYIERSKINNISFYLFISKLTILALALISFILIMRPYFV